MSAAVQSQLYGLAIMTFFIGLGVVRRMRPQPVRAQRIATSGILIVLLIATGLVGAGGRIIGDPVALVLIPVFAAAGAGLGWYLVHTMTFWTDPQTGALWRRGGGLFALILVATIAIRFGLRTLLFGSPFAGGYGPQASGSHGLLYDLSADLLFLSLGLWGARAYLLVQRSRAHEAAQAAGASAGR